MLKAHPASVFLSLRSRAVVLAAARGWNRYLLPVNAKDRYQPCIEQYLGNSKISNGTSRSIICTKKNGKPAPIRIWPINSPQNLTAPSFEILNKWLHCPRIFYLYSGKYFCLFCHSDRMLYLVFFHRAQELTLAESKQSYQ